MPLSLSEFSLLSLSDPKTLKQPYSLPSPQKQGQQREEILLLRLTGGERHLSFGLAPWLSPLKGEPCPIAIFMCPLMTRENSVKSAR